MPILTNPKLETIRHHSREYGVSVRTIYRWLRDGVDLSDLTAVTMYLSSQKTSSPAALDAVETLLKTKLKSIQ